MNVITEGGNALELYRALQKVITIAGSDAAEVLPRLHHSKRWLARVAKLAASFPAEIFAADLIRDGYSIAIFNRVPQDVVPAKFDISKLKSRSFLMGEPAISGDVLRKRAVDLKGNLGLSDGKRLLVEQSKIPVEFRDFYIPLPGTVLRGEDGHLYLVRLIFGRGRWYHDFVRFGGDWSSVGRLACTE